VPRRTIIRRWASAALQLVVNLLAVTAIALQSAHAIDLPPPADIELPPPADAPAIPKKQHAAVDGSATFTSFGNNSFDLNGTFAPWTDINESGFRLRLTGSASWYRFTTGTNPQTFGSGNTVEGNLLAGYQISLQRVSVIGLVGAAIAESRDQGVSRTLTGAKAVVSMYATPWDHTMAYSSLSYSTIADFLQLQSKFGVRLFGDFYTGPEVNFSWRNVVPSFNNVATTRIGWHVSAVTFGPVQVGVSGGWAHSRDLGSGYYGGLNFYGAF
jgi:Cellulose biosynthesis protein BcsS